MTTRRLRIASLVITPVLVWDDGEEMTPGPKIKPITVPLSKLTEVAEKLPAEVTRVEAETLAAVTE